MKKVLAILLVGIMMLSCTACSWSHGNPAAQEEAMLQYVEKYYGKAEIVRKEVTLLDTATIFQLKDVKDGFEYPMTVMEVYMSDLGFVPSEGEHKDAKTLVYDGQFVMHYVANLVENKIPSTEYLELLNRYPEVYDVSILTYENTLANMFTVDVEETAFMVEKINTHAFQEIAQLLKKYDDRGVLDYYIMPVYEAVQEGEAVQIKYNGEKASVLGYYDFYFDCFVSPEQFDGVGMLHDYLIGKNVKDPSIVSVILNYDMHSVTPPEGFSFVPNLETKGTLIRVAYDGKSYDFFSLLGTQEYTTERDKYGIYEGSFLSAVANERTGGADVMIAYYAAMYPSLYTNLTVFLKEVAE